MSSLLKQLITASRGFKKTKSTTKLDFLFFTLMGVFGYFSAIAHGTSSIDDKKSTPIPKGTKIKCELIKVIDGDTITANCNHKKTKIRLVGIDAPEMQQEPWGRKAQKALAQMFHVKYFELHSEGNDIYERTLGVIWVGRLNLNYEMVKRGFAVAYLDKSPDRIYKKAEQDARRRSIGIWAQKGLHQTPQEWRRYGFM